MYHGSYMYVKLVYRSSTLDDVETFVFWACPTNFKCYLFRTMHLCCTHALNTYKKAWRMHHVRAHQNANWKWSRNWPQRYGAALEATIHGVTSSLPLKRWKIKQQVLQGPAHRRESRGQPWGDSKNSSIINWRSFVSLNHPFKSLNVPSNLLCRVPANLKSCWTATLNLQSRPPSLKFFQHAGGRSMIFHFEPHEQQW